MMPKFEPCETCPDGTACLMLAYCAASRAATVARWIVGNPAPEMVPAGPFPPVPAQVWPEPQPPDPQAVEMWREANWRDYKREMLAAGIVEMHEAAPSGQLAFTATREQWVAFLEKLEADAEGREY